MTYGPQDPYGRPPEVPPYQPQPGYQQPYGYAPPRRSDGMATAALVVGVVALLGTCAYGIGLLGSPVALILGRISMKRIDASGGALDGRGLAKAGFILGIIGTVLLVLFIALIVVLIVAGMNGAFDPINVDSGTGVDS